MSARNRYAAWWNCDEMKRGAMWLQIDQQRRHLRFSWSDDGKTVIVETKEPLRVEWPSFDSARRFRGPIPWGIAD